MRDMPLTMGIILCWVAYVGAQPNPNDRDAVAKETAEHFVGALTIEKNLDKGLGFVALPFAKIEQAGAKPLQVVLIKENDELNKRITKELDLRGDEKKAVATKIKPYNAEERKTLDADFGAEYRKAIDQVLTDDDRTVIVQVTSGGFPMDVFVLVAWRDGKAKVVGCGYFYAR